MYNIALGKNDGVTFEFKSNNRKEKQQRYLIYLFSWMMGLDIYETYETFGGEWMHITAVRIQSKGLHLPGPHIVTHLDNKNRCHLHYNVNGYYPSDKHTKSVLAMQIVDYLLETNCLGEQTLGEFLERLCNQWSN